RLDRLLHEGNQTGRRGVAHAAHAQASHTDAFLLYGHCNQRFAFGLTAGNAFFRAAPIGLVDLHHAAEPLASRPHHRPPQLVQPSPSRLIAAEAEHALQPERARSVLLRSDVPHRAEPQPQRLTRVLEDRAGGHRRLPTAKGALEPNLAHGPGTLMPAARTAKSVGPA